MTLERGTLDIWDSRKTELESEKNAWRDIITRITSLNTKTDVLTTSSLWNNLAVSLSNEDILSVTSNSLVQEGTYDIKVKQLAYAHSILNSARSTI